MQTEVNSSSSNTAAALRPAVDITEDESGIVLLADLPGVDKNDLSIRVDGRTLSFEAPIALGEANALVSMYAEIRANRYRRQFELSSELDGTAISAQMSNGVLTLRIPKLERARPRRIEVQAA
jgi:HSP20 family molecular chaperone IbpA